MRGLIKSFFWNHSAKVLEYIFIYLLSLLLARELGAQLYGVYATIISITILMLNLSSLGFEATLTKYTAQFLTRTDGIPEIRFVSKYLMIIRVLISLSLLFLLYLLKDPVASLFKNDELASYIFIVIFYILFQSLINFIVNLLLGALKTKPIFYIGVVSRIISLIAAYCLLKFNYGVKEILIMLAIVSSFTFLTYFLSSQRYILGVSRKIAIKPILKFGMAVWIISLLTFLLGKQAAILLLNYFLGKSSQVGYYEIAFSLTQAIGYSVLIGMSGVSLAVFSKLAITGSDKFAYAWELIIKGMQLILIPIISFTVVYAREIIRFFYTESYDDSIILFQCFALFMLASWIIGECLNLTVLYSLGMQKMVIISRSLSGIINLALNIALIPKYQALGAIIATGISTFTAIAWEFIWAKNRIGGKFPLRFLLKMCMITLIAIGLIRISDEIFYSSIIMKFFQFLIILIILLVITKPLSGSEISNIKQMLLASKREYPV